MKKQTSPTIPLKLFLILLLITVFTFPAPAAAQEKGKEEQKQRSIAASADARSNLQRHSAKGRILQTAAVDIVNSRRQHVLAKVETSDGTRVNIDLGPKKNLIGVDLQGKKHIKVYGFEGKINNDVFLIADRLQVDGRRIIIDRQGSKRLKKFTATILSTRTLSINEHTHRLARVKLENGLRTTVNLGPAASLPELSRLKQIQLLARITEINGRKALIAERILTDGKTYRINWDRAQKRIGQSSG